MREERGKGLKVAHWPDSDECLYKRAVLIAVQSPGLYAAEHIATKRWRCYCECTTLA